LDDTLAWLERLYGNSPGYFAVTAFAGGKPRATKWFSTAELQAAAKTIIATGKRADVYVSVGTHDTKQEEGRRGGERSILSIPGFWADLDIGELGHKPASLPNPPDESSALSIMEGLPEPSMLMHSGGGLQAFWLFDEPWVLDEPIEKKAAKEASNEWHNLLEARGKEKGYHVDKTASLDRILRVPGTGNHKADQIRPVNARVIDGRSYPVVEMASLGIPEPSISPTKDSPQAIEDNFPLSWEEILSPHGWTKCGENENGSGLWSRPGKGCGEGHSATTNPYGVPVLVNFSASDELPSGPGNKLTKLKVWAHLNYGGDLKAAKEALRKMVKLSSDDLTKVASRFAETRINWESLWTDVNSEPDWLVEPLIERGRQVAVFSEAKAGKSLAMLEWSLALAIGKDPVSKEDGRKPVRVLYVDKENTKEDIRGRAGKMGYEGQILEHLFYYSFPDFAWLDTEQGGLELYALAKYHDVELVVIDTLSRVVEGEENNNDTYHNFYKHTGVRLKADGISLVRLDHSGKDVHKGMRGASSKTTDVDEVWQLIVDNDDVVFTRTHSRTHHGVDRIEFTRIDEPFLHHEIRSNAMTFVGSKEQEIMVFLDLLRVPIDAPERTAWDAVKAEGTRVRPCVDKNQCYSRDDVRDAQKKRRGD
jgi:AAA domain